jgi:hypothetical protein
MSKRHQASRRRTYGRRQHEMHEVQDRLGRLDGPSGWLGGTAITPFDDSWGAGSTARESGDMAFLRGSN